MAFSASSLHQIVSIERPLESPRKKQRLATWKSSISPLVSDGCGIQIRLNWPFSSDFPQRNQFWWTFSALSPRRTASIKSLLESPWKSQRLATWINLVGPMVSEIYEAKVTLSFLLSWQSPAEQQLWVSFLGVFLSLLHLHWALLGKPLGKPETGR